MFELLTSQNRYAVLYRIANAKRSETRVRRIEQFVAMLARGETVYTPEANSRRLTLRARQTVRVRDTRARRTVRSEPRVRARARANYFC